VVARNRWIGVDSPLRDGKKHKGFQYLIVPDVDLNNLADSRSSAK